MQLHVEPRAVLALRDGAVAIASYGATRVLATGRRDHRVEDAMNETEEGLTFRKDDDQANGKIRWKRTFRLGTNGPGVEIDATGFARIKVKRLP